MIVRELLAKFGLALDEPSFKKADSLIEGLKTKALAISGVLVSIGGIKMAFNVAREAAEFADALTIFEAAGNSLDEFRAKTKGLLSDKDLVTQFNLASQFGITKDQFLEFANIADAAAKKLGKSQAFIFESLITGTARASKPILDDAGILLDAEKMISEGAKKLNKTSATLTETEKRGIITEGVLIQGRKIVASVQGVNATVSDVFDQWDSGWSNAKLALGQVVLEVGRGLLPPLIKLFNLIAANKKKLIDIFKGAADKITTFLSSVKVLIALVGGLQNVLIGLGVIFGVLLVAQIGQAIAALAAFTAAEIATKLVVLADALLIGAAFIALAAIIAMLGEEILAAFDPDKLGLFEAMQGKWGDLVARIMDGFSLTEDGAGNFLKLLEAIPILAIQAFDKFFEVQFKLLSAWGSVWDFIVSAVETAPTRIETAWKNLWKWLDPKVKIVTDLMDKVSNFDTGSAFSNLFEKGSLPNQIFSGNVSASPAAVAAGNSRGTVVNNLDVSVDAQGQTLNEGVLSSMIRKHVDDVLTSSNRQAMDALTPAGGS